MASTVEFRQDDILSVKFSLGGTFAWSGCDDGTAHDLRFNTNGGESEIQKHRRAILGKFQIDRHFGWLRK